jgi:hypothetical protein
MIVIHINRAIRTLESLNFSLINITIIEIKRQISASTRINIARNIMYSKLCGDASILPINIMSDAIAGSLLIPQTIRREGVSIL